MSWACEIYILNTRENLMDTPAARLCPFCSYCIDAFEAPLSCRGSRTGMLYATNLWGQPRSPFGLVCTAAAPMLCASKEERPQHVEYGGNECQTYEAFTLAKFSLGCEPWRSRRDASYLAAQEASMSWNGDVGGATKLSTQSAEPGREKKTSSPSKV
ncbi:hypothetical protein OOU_Y34scaffold00235g3 [Pyricularia oryzae Y34]|uniref:Uncharacterized protein n=1 Tax=Pyricularia oryzae (strain Y34) TaxID=1143189 RepID=A0AA97P4Z4_PYRO3|nr:hypothetical protein OOU_Y34scaffold00235g3 [Pyricularia oryzae Y34]